jgi:hypothetical protein
MAERKPEWAETGAFLIATTGEITNSDPYTKIDGQGALRRHK